MFESYAFYAVNAPSSILSGIVLNVEISRMKMTNYLAYDMSFSNDDPIYIFTNKSSYICYLK